MASIRACFLRQLRKTYDEMVQYEEELLSLQNEIKMVDLLLGEIAQSLTDHDGNDGAWGKFLQATEGKRRLVESEVRSLFNSGGLVSKKRWAGFPSWALRLYPECHTRAR